MPTRNQAAFIRDSVRSVLAQADQLPGGLELVVADGASTDGTPAILAELAAAHPALRWVSEPDAGPADAVNKAVAMAGAPLIGWLNSDDLYAPGAAARAVQALQEHPEWVMVYGQGEHVDIDGRFLGLYPTLGPATPLAAWADGCPICQPTAFFRRQDFLALGGLDRGLRVAFDFDFWLRLFKAHPRGIGFVDQVQARSRLHDAGITLSMREQVALEAMHVIRCHLGPAPPHWLLTHVHELLREHPFHARPLGRDLYTHVLQLGQRAAADLGRAGVVAFEEALDRHRALHLATEGFGCSVHADGWMAADGELRLLQSATPVRLIRLHCRHASPVGGPLRLSIEAPDGETFRYELARPGPFLLEVPVTGHYPETRQRFALTAQDAFVPAQVEPGSQDRRSLAFLVDNVELI